MFLQPAIPLSATFEVFLHKKPSRLFFPEKSQEEAEPSHSFLQRLFAYGASSSGIILP